MSSHQCNECLEKQKEIDRLRAECKKFAESLKEMEALNSANQALIAEYEQILDDMDFNEEQDDTKAVGTGETEQDVASGTPETAQTEDLTEKMADMIKQLKMEKTNLEIENDELLNRVRELEAVQETLKEERDLLMERLELAEDI